MIDYPIHNRKFSTSYSANDRDIISDVMGIFLIVFSAILFISFLTMNINDTVILSKETNSSIKNILGPFGAYISGLSFFAFGKSSYIMAFFYAFIGTYFILKNDKPNILKTVLLFLLTIISGSVLFDLFIKSANSYERGGVVGESIRDIINIDKLSIFIFSAILFSSIFFMIKDILPNKKFVRYKKQKKVDTNLRNNNKNGNAINIKEIVSKKIASVKDNYASIPFITIKSVDENEIKNKKFLEIENMKSAINKDIETFDNKTEKELNANDNNIETKNKTIDNKYKDAFKNKKTFNGDIGDALSKAIFSFDSNTSKTHTDTFEKLKTKDSVDMAIDETSKTAVTSVPMTLDDMIRKNKLKHNLPELKNIYTSSGVVEENKTPHYPTTLKDYLNPKKIEVDFEIDIIKHENTDNINTRSEKIDELMASIELEKQTYKDEEIDTYKNDVVEDEKHQSSIFEFEASRTSNKPYRREDHFSPQTSPKVDYVLPLREDVDNTEKESVYDSFKNTSSFDNSYNKHTEDKKMYHESYDSLEDNNYTITEKLEDKNYSNNREILSPIEKEEIETPTIILNNNKASKLRIDIVDFSDDIDESFTTKENISTDDDGDTSTIDFLLSNDENYETGKNENTYLSDYIESIETEGTATTCNTTKQEHIENIEIKDIDYAKEIELERERIKAKIKESINIELPKPKHNIHKVHHHVNDNVIQTNYESRYIDKNYRKPPLELLERAIQIDDSNVITAIKQTAIQLENTLLDFGIEAKVTGVSRGPVVTRYELELSSGTRVSKIINLTDNIALALASESVRIIAPIPGRSVIGIEIPNKVRASVSLREILENPDFKLSKKDIPFALGKGIYGNNVITDLAEAPHLLVAGTTGSGKSVCLSTIILSLLFRFRPDELKFIFIDKKRVELSIYNGIPHLMSPVVSDEKKATVVLRHIVDIMERRYEKMEKFFVRNVKAYNEKVAKLISDGETDFEGESLELFPYIVVVIDELHNLMVVSSKEVEDLISRLAGMSRAVGIHLIIATQRPSADVVTGIIKANLPTRIAFQVPNKTNSRIIIDMAGAEQLLGKGDGLFCCSGSQMPERVQGAFVSDNEVKKVVDYLSQIDPLYDEALIAALDKNDVDGKDSHDDDDMLDEELWEDAINVVARTRKASASFLQRRLKIGYNRAARIVEIMERQGLVGPENGSKPRDVFIDAD